MSTSDEEIKVLLTADSTQLKAGMEESAAAVNASMAQVKAGVAAASGGVTQLGADFNALDEVMAGHVKKAQDVTAAQQALDRLMAQGAITAKEQADALDMLTASEKLTTTEKATLTAATEAQTVATEESTVALGINGGVAREVGVLFGELARGNYHRLEGSTITLANRTGFLSSALGFLLSPAGLVVEAFAAVGVAALEAQGDIDRLRASIMASGNANAVNVQQMEDLEGHLQSLGIDYSRASGAVNGLAKSGQNFGASFQAAAEAAAYLSRTTGESIDKVVKEVARLADDPVKASKSLNDSLNFLTPAEAEQIKNLTETGDKAGAAAIAINALRDAESSRAQAMQQQGAEATGIFDRIGAGAKDAWHAVGHFFTPWDERGLQENLNSVNEQIQRFAKAQGGFSQDSSNNLHFDPSGYSPEQIQEVNALLDKRRQLLEQIRDEREKSEEQSQRNAANKGAVDKTLGSAKKADHGDHDAAQGDRDAYNEMRLQHSMSLQDEKQFWQGKLDAAKKGTQEYRQAVNELLQIKQKEAQQGAQAERKEEAEAKRAAAEKVRSAKQAAAEAKKSAEEQLHLEEAQADATRQLADASLQTKKATLNAELAEGKITQDQALAAYRALIQGKYAADLTYYQEKERLEASDQAALVRDQTQIALAYQHMLQQMQSAEAQFHAKSESAWQKYSQRIQGAIQGAVNGMIFQHMTLRNAVGQIALTIGETVIDKSVLQPLEKWIWGENAKTAATAAGAAERGAIESTASAQSVAISAATTIKQIVMKGWETIANTWSAISAIPMIGPFLAPAMAVAAGAGVFALAGSVSSAAGGWDRVPVDDAPALLHRNEMVLPANLADRVRGMTDQGGGAGGDTHHHYHINAMDARSFRDWSRRNPHEVAAAAQNARRKGY